jgi:hypothetical protein
VLVKIGVFLSGFVNHMERGHLSQHKSSETNPRSESDKPKSELVVGLRSESSHHADLSGTQGSGADAHPRTL